MKRKHIDPAADDKYGHWWFEIGDPLDPTSESYGWWPEQPVGPANVLAGVSGALNGHPAFGGSSRTRDPHHADAADEEFHPLVPATDPRTDDQIADCLRRFATSFGGRWSWPLGPNCHTFQKLATAHCGLSKRAPTSWY